MKQSPCVGTCGGTRPGFKKYFGMCQLCYAYEQWHLNGVQFRHAPTKRFPGGMWRVNVRAKWRPMETYSIDLFLPGGRFGNKTMALLSTGFPHRKV